MSKKIFMGGAGSGKTFQLMATLEQRLQKYPLASHQKVLALTYMNGSRRRLDERLNKLTKAYECLTIDSFAWRLVTRWQSLAIELGYQKTEIEDYDRVVEIASKLLKIKDIANWVAITYPVIVSDETQDISCSRLSIIQVLYKHTYMVIAADEFQCLDSNLRPNPASEWLKSLEGVEILTSSKRTRQTELLEAAAALRDGGALKRDGRNFRVVAASSVALAGTFLSNEIAWYRKGGKVAVITTAYRGYAEKVVEYSRTKKNNQNNGPFEMLDWEKSQSSKVKEYISSLDLKDDNFFQDIVKKISSLGDYELLKDIERSLIRERRGLGKKVWKRKEVESQIEKQTMRRFKNQGERELIYSAMTVHGAKNREFDNVIVLWPASTYGDEEQKRRLLYNAVTRAKKRCLVLVQVERHLEKPPFS